MAKHGGIKDSGEFFVINPASRKVTVPHAHKAIGTVGEHCAEQVTFMCPQIVDGHDISQCARRYITWINVRDEVGNDELRLAQVENAEEGMVYMTWTIRNPLTVEKGIVQFSVHFEDEDEAGATLYRWSTATCRDCDILESINSLIATYESIYVSGDTLVIADYTPVTDETFVLDAKGIIPDGTITITKNGYHDVGSYARANVLVDAPSGTLEINSNGYYNVMNHATAYVNIPMSAPTVQVSADGVVTANANGKNTTVKLSTEHDAEFTADNIRKGATIFGVEGRYDPHKLVSGTVVSNTNQLCGVAMYYSGTTWMGEELGYAFNSFYGMGDGESFSAKFVSHTPIIIMPSSGANSVLSGTQRSGYDVETTGNVEIVQKAFDGSLFMLRPTGDDFTITLIKKG